MTRTKPDYEKNTGLMDSMYVDRIHLVKNELMKASYAIWNENKVLEIFEIKGELHIVWQDEYSLIMLRKRAEKLWQACKECWVHHFTGKDKIHYLTTLDGEKEENPY